MRKIVGTLLCILASTSCVLNKDKTPSKMMSVDDASVHLSFDEAKALFLSTHRVHDIHRDALPNGKSPVASAQRKFRRLMTRPFIYRNPLAPRAAGQAHIKGLQWNVLYGVHADTIGAMLAGDYSQLRLRDLKTIAPIGPVLSWLQSHQLRTATERLNMEAAAVKNPDFIVLNEVDWGLGRSNYRNVAKDLAQRLNMHYAFAANYLEIDNFYSVAPSFEKEAKALLDLLSMSSNTSLRNLTEPYKQWLSKLSVDEGRYRGLSGNVILSRYPIRRAYIINVPLELQFKDWFEEEKQRLTMTEWLKRSFIKGAFLTDRVAMVRYGMDNILVTELEVPGMPENTLTVASFHPEIFARPDERRQQIEYAVRQLIDVKGPLVFAGDMNTSGHDGTNWSAAYLMKRTLVNPHSWFSFSLNQFFAGAGAVSAGLNYLKNFQDPTAPHIPIIAPNPENKLFGFLKAFQFADGGRFDHGSLQNRVLQPDSWGRSNERDKTGFVPTFETNRNLFETGSFKLDWFFVKSSGNSTEPSKNPGAPLASMVARSLNRQVMPPGSEDQDQLWFDERVSDHNPSVVWIRTQSEK